MKKLLHLPVICLPPSLSSCGMKIEPSSSAAWTQLASMPTARGGFAKVMANGKIYAIGGEVLTREDKARSAALRLPSTQREGNNCFAYLALL